MAGTTPFLGLYLPGGGSTGTWTPDETADIDPINQNFVDIDAGLAAWGLPAERNQQFFRPAASLGSLTGMKRGDTYQESDGEFKKWFYDGANWISNEGGLYLIRPTGVNGHAGATIGTDGHVKFNAVAASSVINIEGIFSSRFRNYVLKNTWSNKPSGACIIQGLVGATPITATTYSRAWQGLIGGARDDGQLVSQTAFGEALIPVQGGAGAGFAEVLAPNLAEPTWVLSQTAQVGGTTGVKNTSSCLNSTDQLTGLRISLTAGGTWTGDFAIYGIA